MPTVTVRLRARTARALEARAAREGRTLDALLADLAEQGAALPAVPARSLGPLAGTWDVPDTAFSDDADRDAAETLGT